MNAIFAVNRFDCFGTGNDMPWPRNNVDLQRFRELTINNTVVMGKNTWNSNMPKPLSNRKNCVLSKTLVDSRCEIYRNVTDLLMNLKITEKIFVIGGAETLWMLRTYIDKVYLTRHNDTTKGEIILDTEKYLNDFTLESKTVLDDHTFEIYNRIV